MRNMLIVATRLIIGTFLPTCMILAMIAPGELHAQGRFLQVMGTAPTRLYSADGPLAGQGIWGQFLVGLTPETLTPFGVSIEHISNGLIEPQGTVSVPWIPCNTGGYVQFVAWDGNLWGTDLASVPMEQLGRTDAIEQSFTCHPLPIVGPVFTQPAIVPIPEPSILILVVACGCLTLTRWFRMTNRG